MPFPRIRELKAGYGVTLIDAAIEQTGLPKVEAPNVEAPKKRRWQGLRKGRRIQS